MIVTQSRKHCVWYFKEINKQLEERGMTYKSLVGFSGEVSIDGEKFTESGCNQSIGHEGNVPLGLKNPQYRLLVVANKFQTGFDEPLIQSMYVDKKLGGVQCVQTLSRLNRTTSGKTQTFTLDFVNEPDEVRESFQRFYQSTILDGETDPNRLYDTQREIYDFHLYTHEDVNRFCEIFYDPNRDEGNLHPILDQIVDRFKSIEDEETREEFRSQIQSYIRLYGYLSQIVTFSDIELEKSFVFLKYLNKKLPKRETDRFDISDTIDLDSLRIQKIHEEMEGLERTDTVVEPPTFGGGDVVDPVLDLLSEIINQVNNTYGVNLTDDDKIDIERLRNRLVTDPEIIKYMNGQNTEDNKKNFFKEQFDGVMVDYINERFDFYKKMDENPSVKNHIFKMMYENYSESGSRL